MLFSLLKHYLELYRTDSVLKVFRSLYRFTTSISHGVENYFPRLWGTGISDALFFHEDPASSISVILLTNQQTGIKLILPWQR